MNCRHVRELAGPYLYGDLSPEQMKAIRTHAQQCAGCREDLRTQTAVLSALPSDAPELTDEERQRIAWSVKGAVKLAEPQARRPWFGFSPAYALAAVVIVGMVAVKVVGSMSPDVSHVPSAEKAKIAVVEVKDAKSANKKIEDTELERTGPGEDERVVQDRDGARVEERRDARQPEAGSGVRHRRHSPFVNLAVRGRSKEAAKPVVNDPPAPVVDNAVTPDVKMDQGDTKLPEPTETNDAQTAPSTNNETGTTE